MRIRLREVSLWTKSRTIKRNVRLPLTIPPQTRRASQSRAYEALFLNPVTNATAVPTTAMGCQGTAIHFQPMSAYNAVGMALTTRNTTVSRRVHATISFSE